MKTMLKGKRGILFVLVVAVVAIGAIYFLLRSSTPRTELEKFKNLCESTGGYFMSCEVATTMLCSAPTIIDGMRIVCSCNEERRWDPDRGCVKK